MGIRFYINTPKGEIMARLDQDVDGAHRAISGTLVTTVGDIFQLVLGTTALLSLDWQLGLIVLLVFPLFFIPTRLYATQLHEDGQDVIAWREYPSDPSFF